MKFGEALKRAVKGKKIGRSGWKKIGKFVYFVPTHKVPVKDWTGYKNANRPVLVLAHYDMCLTRDTVMVNWSPNQDELYAEDWEAWE